MAMQALNGEMCLLEKKKNLSEYQKTIVNVVETERKERDNRERNVVLFGVPISTATSDEEREKEDEAATFEILAEIGIEKKDVEKIKRFKANPNRTAAAKSLPVRVTFKWEEDVLISLKKAKALKDSS